MDGVGRRRLLDQRGVTRLALAQDRFGSLLANPSAGEALQAMSAVFLVLRLKKQGLPGLTLPKIPDPTDQAGA